MFSGLLSSALNLITGGKRDHGDLDAEIDVWIQTRSQLRSAGFFMWLAAVPPDGPVECIYEDNPDRSFEADPHTMHPATNVWGLWWRPIRAMVDVTYGGAGSAPAVPLLVYSDEDERR